MSARRVCLISPGQLSTNPRLVKEATALADAGYAVHVVCGRFAVWARDFDVALKDPRWGVTTVAFGRHEASANTYLMQTARRRFSRMLVGAGATNARAIEFAHAPVVHDLCRAALSVPADLYIAHYVAALPAAARAARHHKARYAFDAEDFHLGDLPEEPQHALEKRIIHAIEGRYLPDASYVTAASPMIADAYAETYGIAPPTVILNVFPRQNSPQDFTARGGAEPGPSVYWFSQTVGPGRGLETAICALAYASSLPHLYLRGTAATGYQEAARALARQAEVEHRLHFLSPAPPGDLEKVGAQYDLGYSGETGSSSNRCYALGNKLFSYITSGIPIVASDIPAHRRLADEFGQAMRLFPVDNPAALAAVWDQMLQPDELARARMRASELAFGRFCWEVEQEAWLRTIDRAMAA